MRDDSLRYRCAQVFMLSVKKKEIKKRKDVKSGKNARSDHLKKSSLINKRSGVTTDVMPDPHVGSDQENSSLGQMPGVNAEQMTNQNHHQRDH